MFLAGYSTEDVPREWIEEYARARAARWWGVPPWDEMLDNPYWVNMAFACENVEAEVKNHFESKAAKGK